MHALLMQALHVSVQPKHALGCDISCASPTNHALRVLWHWAGARGEEGMKCSLASLLGAPSIYGIVGEVAVMDTVLQARYAVKPRENVFHAVRAWVYSILQ